MNLRNTFINFFFAALALLVSLGGAITCSQQAQAQAAGYPNAQLYNYIGTGSPSLSMTLSNSGAGWTPFTIGYQSHGSIPTSTSASSTWSSWNIQDVTNNVYYGTLTITYDGTNGVKYSSYTAPSPSTGNYLNGIVISNPTSATPSISVNSVSCSYCNSASIQNNIGTSSLAMTMTLASSAAGWNPYSIGFGGAGAIPVPGGWSSWNVYDASNNYYGNISINYSNNTPSLGTYTTPSPSYGYSLSNITLGALNTSVNPPVATLTATPVGAGGPFPNAPPATPPKNFTLSTQGNQLLVNGTTPIRIKGFARPSLEWSQQGEGLSPTDIANMAKLGANAIRINMNANFWLTSAPSTTMGSYQQIIDAMIYYATQNNMIVILDFHWYNSTVQQQPLALNDGTGNSLTFWTQVATKYQSFGNVMFELYNEPVNLPYSVWLNGGSYSGSNWYGMQQLYDTVRAVAPNTVVIAGGLDYAYYLGFLVQGVDNCGTGTDCFIKSKAGSTAYATNIMYNSHPYDTKGSSSYTYTPTGGGSTVPADFATNYSGVMAAKFPIIWTEFGDNIQADYSSPYPYITNVVNQINEANLIGAHYTGFAWYQSTTNPTQAWFPVLTCGGYTDPKACYSGTQVIPDMATYPGTSLTIQ